MNQAHMKTARLVTPRRSSVDPWVNVSHGLSTCVWEWHYGIMKKHSQSPAAPEIQGKASGQLEELRGKASGHFEALVWLTWARSFKLRCQTLETVPTSLIQELNKQMSGRFEDLQGKDDWDVCWHVQHFRGYAGEDDWNVCWNVEHLWEFAGQGAPPSIPVSLKGFLGCFAAAHPKRELTHSGALLAR